MSLATVAYVATRLAMTGPEKLVHLVCDLRR